MEDPQALFQSLGWAKRFIKEQQKIWINAKFKIYEIKEIKL